MYSEDSDNEELKTDFPSIAIETNNLEVQTVLEQKKLKLLKERTKTTYAALNEANVARKIEEAKRRTALAKAEAISVESKAQKDSTDGAWNSKVDRVVRWLKVAFLTIVLLIFIFVSGLGLYYLYRVVSEEPIIKTVTETVTETVEKEVIPEECTQVRRNGKIYVSCDGVTVQGASTIAESGVDEIPELIN
ncbi:hypothetical protein AB4098_01330 [Vibrio cyclitrophicus]